MDKLIENGKKAVLISRGFGAGWSTCNDKYARELALDKRIVEYAMKNIIDAGATEYDIYGSAFKKFLENIGYHDIYLGGIDGLDVVWIDEDAEFYIKEYDGRETIELRYNEGFWMS